THLALIAAVDARLLVLDEPTLGLDVLSRKAFYEMLIDEWCDGERSVLISTHQIEEIEALLSDVMMLNEGKLVLNISLEETHRRSLFLIVVLPVLLLVAITLAPTVEGDLRAPDALMAMATAAVTLLVTAVVWLAVAFQMPGLARRDVQDRSIEFWSSLPVGHG